MPPRNMASEISEIFSWKSCWPSCFRIPPEHVMKWATAANLLIHDGAVVRYLPTLETPAMDSRKNQPLDHTKGPIATLNLPLSQRYLGRNNGSNKKQFKQFTYHSKEQAPLKCIEYSNTNECQCYSNEPSCYQCRQVWLQLGALIAQKIHQEPVAIDQRLMDLERLL